MVIYVHGELSGKWDHHNDKVRIVDIKLSRKWRLFDTFEDVEMGYVVKENNEGCKAEGYVIKYVFRSYGFMTLGDILHTFEDQYKYFFVFTLILIKNHSKFSKFGIKFAILPYRGYLNIT